MPYPESTFICKTLCCVWFQQHIESPFAYSKLDLPSFYTSINCPTLLAVKILIFLMFAANIFAPFIASPICISWARPGIFILQQ